MRFPYIPGNTLSTNRMKKTTKKRLPFKQLLNLEMLDWFFGYSVGMNFFMWKLKIYPGRE